MKRSSIAAGALACVVAWPALAGETQWVEPGARLAWTFGAGANQAAPSLSLGLYPNDRGWQRLWATAGADELAMAVDKPAVFELRLDGTAKDLRLMGLSLGADSSQAEDSSGNWGTRIGMIALGLGAALALVVYAVGDAVEDSNPTVQGNGDNDSPGDADDRCFDLPLGINGCLGGR
ncbi:hypothetical protein [Sinimarinibacterium flocculans]|uniref:hypothetical protein n=1 Tax=Sinimarinibacterium flocculans TaxID=985250 RepID=UPI0035141972